MVMLEFGVVRVWPLYFTGLQGKGGEGEVVGEEERGEETPVPAAAEEEIGNFSNKAFFF